MWNCSICGDISQHGLSSSEECLNCGGEVIEISGRDALTRQVSKLKARLRESEMIRNIQVQKINRLERRA